MPTSQPVRAVIRIHKRHRSAATMGCRWFFAGYCAIAISAGLLCSGDVVAQVAAHVTIVSDFRYRGMSYSDGNPAAQGGLIFDHQSGAYAGGFVSSTKFPLTGTPRLRTVFYAGIAHRLNPDWSLEAGLARFDYHGGRIRWPYEEGHLGLTWRHSSLRIHYAPDYFDRDIKQLYGEVNTVLPVSSKVAIVLHLGRLRQFDNISAIDAFDFSLGASYTSGPLIAEASLAGSDAGDDCRARKNNCDPTLVLKVHLSF